jgi:hypothetical protein
MTKREKFEDREIERLYGRYCSGMQLDVMRIGALFEGARAIMRAGATEAQIGAWMVNFVERSHR